MKLNPAGNCRVIRKSYNLVIQSKSEAQLLNTERKPYMDLFKQPLDKLRDDLDFLNKEWRDIEGSPLSANQCYHFETDPPHFLYNLNCPDSLRQKLQELLMKHFPRQVTNGPN